MTWVKLDDQFFLRPRCRSVGVEGRALHLAGICYCSINTTDGVIVASAIPLVAAQAEVAPSVVDLLLNVGLWATHVEGFEVIGYLDFNPSREKVLAERAAARERARARTSREQPPKDSRSSQASGRSPSDSYKSSSSLGLLGTRPDDDEISPAVWTRFAEKKLAAQRPGEVRNAAKWLEVTTANARTELGPKAVDLLSRYDLNDSQLADVLLSPTAPQWLNTCRRPA